MAAVQVVLDKKMSSYKASDLFGIPRSTIYDRVVRSRISLSQNQSDYSWTKTFDRDTL